MPRPGYLIDNIYLHHEPGSRHPESPSRLQAVGRALVTIGAHERWQEIEPRPAQLEELELVHHASLLDRVEKASRRAPSYLDPDTIVCHDSYRVALFASGGVLECTEALLTGQIRNFFAFVRPPGHHAEPEKSMGFCLFNNVAVAATWARVAYGLERVAIVDFDVHHGNGTQACFYDNPHVFFVSSHQFPFYPGTGEIHEIGIREGRGYTLNFPLPDGTGDDTFVPIYSRIVAPVLEQYRPQLILVSAGFDGHYKDPLGGLNITRQGFASAAASLIRVAEACCDGRIGFVLEGGYSMQALEDCSRAVMEQMEARDPQEMKIAESVLFHDISEELHHTMYGPWRW
jgi:acetoin utilization deacetylase AcuC-like enzyme